MHLYELPMIFALIGLTLYVVLAGADFGAGTWQLLAGSGPQAPRIRDHAHESMAPVWEANHVWLVFVLTVVWTAYPAAFGSIASTLSIPLFIAAIGIIFRGATYALRAGVRSEREGRTVDTVFAISSILTPFALGAVVGGIASRRVPVGNAAGHLFSSWLNPTSVLIGVLAVATSGYLAAVYLTADAVRIGEPALQRAFRLRALIAGLVTGVLAIAGLAVLRSDAHLLYRALLTGSGLAALVVSVAAGVGTLALVWSHRPGIARYTAALAVAAIVAGWALAQQPILLRGLTVREAAAPRSTLVLVVVAVLAGGAILFPSLAVLFRLFFGGTTSSGSSKATPAHGPSVTAGLSRPGLMGRVAVGCLIAGIGFLTVASPPWAHAVGVLALFGFLAAGFAAARPDELDGRELGRGELGGGEAGGGEPGPSPPESPPAAGSS